MNTSCTGSGRLDQRHAVLTGAGGGIGAAVAAAYLREGACCTLVDLSPTPSAEVDELAAQYPERMHYLSADITKEENRNRIVDEATKRLGPIDILFNNAGIFDLAPLLESHEAMFDRVFAVNVKGSFFMMQKVLAHMVANGRRGAVINMASQAGRRGEALVGVYCATKAAVISLTQSAGLNLIKHGINVNAIAPGVVDGEHWDGVDALFAKYENRPRGEKKRLVGAEVPFGRMGTAEDLTGMAIFLASQESNYIVAQTYNVDGGNWMS